MAKISDEQNAGRTKYTPKKASTPVPAQASAAAQGRPQAQTTPTPQRVGYSPTQPQRNNWTTPRPQQRTPQPQRPQQPQNRVSYNNPQQQQGGVLGWLQNAANNVGAWWASQQTPTRDYNAQFSSRTAQTAPGWNPYPRVSPAYSYDQQRAFQAAGMPGAPTTIGVLPQYGVYGGKVGPATPAWYSAGVLAPQRPGPEPSRAAPMNDSGYYLARAEAQRASDAFDRQTGWNAYVDRLNAQAAEYLSRPVEPMDTGTPGGYGGGWWDYGGGGGGGGGSQKPYNPNPEWFMQLANWRI